jgi:hypothetical protein
MARKGEATCVNGRRDAAPEQTRGDEARGGSGRRSRAARHSLGARVLWQVADCDGAGYGATVLETGYSITMSWTGGGTACRLRASRRRAQESELVLHAAGAV